MGQCQKGPAKIDEGLEGWSGGVEGTFSHVTPTEPLLQIVGSATIASCTTPSPKISSHDQSSHVRLIRVISTLNPFNCMTDPQTLNYTHNCVCVCASRSPPAISTPPHPARLSTKKQHYNHHRKHGRRTNTAQGGCHHK